MSVRLHVLVLEDQATDTELMVYELQRAEYEVIYQRVQTEAAYVAALQKIRAGHATDVILADYNLPQFNALEALQLLKEYQLDIPFIVVTGTIGEEAAVACIKQGATDYLLKDRLARLGTAVARALEQQTLRNEKLNTQLALQESEERYRLFVENSPIGIFVEQDGQFVYTNPAFANLVGAESSTALLNTLVMPYIHPDFQTQAQERIRFMDDLRQPVPLKEEKYIRQDGQVIDIEATATPIILGGRLAHQVMIRDITKRKQAEIILQQNEQRFRALIEHSSDGIALIDIDGEILYVSPSSIHITGYTPEEFVGLSAFDHIHPNDLPYFISVFERVLDTPKTPFPVQLRFRHKNGHWVWLDGVASNFLAEPGIGAVVGNFRDITERKQVEEAMRQAQKLESLGVLAGGVAHDFNNLLTAILAQNSLALAKILPDNPARNHIEKAVGATQRAADLTRQLLAYSGRGQFEIRPIHFNRLIEENLHLLEVTLPKNVRLHTNLVEPLPLIEADVGQMQQVIMNLIINAAEAMNEQPGTVTITTGIQHIKENHHGLQTYTSTPLALGHYVVLQVQDNGQGMDEKTVSRIFDPFFSTKFAGRGLGLAAVSGIVRGHKGGVMVESQVGQGTTFTLFFPVSETFSPPVMESQTAVSPHTHTCILVIDDEEAVRNALTDILEDEGILVLSSPDGTTGIETYRQQQAEISLIILDLSMPGLSGEQIIQGLQKINSQAPILLSSGYSRTEVNNRFSNVKVKGFLQKPYNITTLVTEIQKYL